MSGRISVCCLVLWLGCGSPAFAQDASGPDAPSGSAQTSTSASALIPPARPGFWAPFTTLPRDLERLASRDGLTVLSVGAAGALTAHRWDRAGVDTARAHLRPAVFEAGNVGGTMLMQVGASIGVYSVGYLARVDRLGDVGADLVRAQVLTQTLVQAGKWTTRRTRPDGSNDLSLPSGHAAGAFATASVLQRHYGWAVGAPAYAFGAYVAAARMSANRHHLSDVLMGAAVGIAAGRSVTVGRGRAQFAVGVSPTAGGAALTFSR